MGDNKENNKEKEQVYKDFDIEIISSPTEKDLENNKTNTSWLYNKLGIAMNDFDQHDKKEKQHMKEEEYKIYWDSLTEEEKFAKERDVTDLAGRPSFMSVDEWSALPTWKKSYHAWLELLPDIAHSIGMPWNLPRDPENILPHRKGIAVGLKNAMVNAFSMPGDIADYIGWTDELGDTLRKEMEFMDFGDPEGAVEQISAIFAQYGAPSVAVMSWLSKMKKAPGFLKAFKRYFTILSGGAGADVAVAGPADINLYTAFSDNIPLPLPDFFRIHEDDSNLVRRVKIGGEFYFVGPLVDTTLMIGKGLFGTGRLLFGNADEVIEIPMPDGNIKEISASKGTFNAVATILNDAAKGGERTAKEIEEGLKLFKDSGIMPPTGSVSGNEGILALQKMYNSSSYSDITLQNILASYQALDDILKKSGFADGISSPIFAKELQSQLKNINDNIGIYNAEIAALTKQKSEAADDIKHTFDEKISKAKNKLESVRENRQKIEIDIGNDFSKKWHDAKNEVQGYLDSIGIQDIHLSNQLASQLDEQLVNQLTYMTLYKNQLYAAIDPKNTPLIKFTIGKKNKAGKDETIIDQLRRDLDWLFKKQSDDDFVWQDLPSKFKEELMYLVSPKRKEPLTLGIIEEKRALFNELHAKAIDNGDLTLARRIEQGKNKIFNNIYDSLGKSKDPELEAIAARAKEATKWFKEEYAPSFHEGLGGTWAEAFKKRQSGSIYASSPEQSVNFFIQQNTKGRTINNSSKYAINQLDQILDPPRDIHGNRLTKPLADPTNPKKELNVIDKENALQIIENFMAAQIATNIRNKTNPNTVITILEAMKKDYSSVLKKYPEIEKSFDDYIESIKSKDSAVFVKKSEMDESAKIQKEITKKEVSDQRKTLDSITEEKKNTLSNINASFSEKIDLANNKLNLYSNKHLDDINLFSFFMKENPQTAINKIINGPNPVENMEKLVNKVNEINIPEVTSGFNDSISLWLKDKVSAHSRIQTSAGIKYPEGTIKPLFAPQLDAIDNILKDKTTIDTLYAAGWTSDSIADLQKLADQLAVLERGKLKVASPGGKTEIIDDLNILQKSRIILASLYGIVKGRGIFAISDMLRKAIGYDPRKVTAAILEDALVHPELAKILLMRESDKSRDLLKTYLTNNYGNLQDVFANQDKEFEIEFNPEINIEPQSKSLVPQINIPNVNPASDIFANANMFSPVGMGREPTGGVDPNRAAFAFGPDDILAQQRPQYAAQGGIMSTNKAFQRVA